MKKGDKAYSMVNLFHEMVAFLTEGVLHEFYAGFVQKLPRPEQYVLNKGYEVWRALFL